MKNENDLWKIDVLDLSTGMKVKSIKNKKNYNRMKCIDKNRLLLSDFEAVTVVNLLTEEEISNFLCLNNDKFIYLGNDLISTFDDNYIKIYNVKNGNQEGRILFQKEIKNFEWIEDKKFIVAESYLYKADLNTRYKQILTGDRNISSLSYIGNNQLAFNYKSYNPYHDISIIDIRTGKRLKLIPSDVD